jgi:hypothetical protein
MPRAGVVHSIKYAHDRGLPSADVFASPMAGEAELLKAVEMVKEHLQGRGLDARQCSPENIREAADGCIRVVSGLIRRGRESRSEDYALFWGWADLAEAIGMHAGASYKPAAKAHRSPFLTWLMEVAVLMPQRTQAVFTRNLGERVEHALQMRRDNAIDSRLFDA